MIKINTVIFMAAAAALALSHFLLLELYLYWRYDWIDIPMHFLGGAVVALGYAAFWDFFPAKRSQLFHFLPGMAFVLSVAVLWEIFEIAIGVIFDERNYIFDTWLDLFMGLLGGATAFMISWRTKDLAS